MLLTVDVVLLLYVTCCRRFIQSFFAEAVLKRRSMAWADRATCSAPRTDLVALHEGALDDS